MEYTVNGTFKMGRKTLGFAKTVEAASEEEARERVYSLLGSKHGTRRLDIAIACVEGAEAAKR